MFLAMMINYSFLQAQARGTQLLYCKSSLGLEKLKSLIDL